MQFEERVGRRYRWYYSPGVWKERKITADVWEISCRATKRPKVGKAPGGPGGPNDAIGARFHWYVIAHEYVTKVTASTYSTVLEGVKFALEVDASPREQRRQAIAVLKALIVRLEEQDRLREAG
jgi:hypothetical protein